MAAIVPIPGPVPGERACCCITVTGDEAPTLEAICAYLDENGIAKVRWPERLQIVESIPLTATRKIIKGRLTEWLRGEQPSTEAPESVGSWWSISSDERPDSDRAKDGPSV